MFERFTEKARRIIFFARYEASQYGSSEIETEHLLLGLVREDRVLITGLVPKLNHHAFRENMDARLTGIKKIPTSVDLPLSNPAKRVLAHMAEEADRLGDLHIGSEHLLLALLREEGLAADFLTEAGAKLDDLRAEIAKHPQKCLSGTGGHRPFIKRTVQSKLHETIEIHGSKWKVEFVHATVGRLREYSWHWEPCPWKAPDVVVARAGGLVSFDLSLAQERDRFELVKGGWKRDHCAVCRWELFETEDPDHGEGFTNGREWICSECHQKFFEGPDFFGSAYSEIT